LSQLGQVGGSAIYWGMVELEVAGVDHGPGGCVQGDPGGIRDGVGYPEKLGADTSQNDFLARFNDVQLGPVQRAALFQANSNQPVSQPGGVDGGPQRGEQVGQRADVVFVPMGDEYAS